LDTRKCSHEIKRVLRGHFFAFFSFLRIHHQPWCQSLSVAR